MIMSVVRVLRTHAEEIGTMSIIGAIADRLEEILNEIQDCSQLQSSTNNRYYVSKLEIRESVCEVADIINDVIEVKAHIDGNNQLALEMSDSKSDLFLAPDNQLSDKLARIHGYMTEHLTELETDYNLDAALVTEFNTLMDKWNAVVVEMQDRKAISSDSTEKLDLLVGEAMDLIRNRLDGMMKLFKHKDAGFYRQYVSARVIIDKKAHRESEGNSREE